MAPWGYSGSVGVPRQCCCVLGAHFQPGALLLLQEDFISGLKGHQWAALHEFQHVDMVLGAPHTISHGLHPLPACDPEPKFLSLIVSSPDHPLTSFLALCIWFIRCLLTMYRVLRTHRWMKCLPCLCSSLVGGGMGVGGALAQTSHSDLLVCVH